MSVSRSRHIDLDQAETSIVRGRSPHERRRAEVEEALAAALAEGDRERASQLRAQLAAVDGAA